MHIRSVQIVVHKQRRDSLLENVPSEQLRHLSGGRPPPFNLARHHGDLLPLSPLLCYSFALFVVLRFFGGTIEKDAH